MNSFRIFRPDNKFYWTNNRIIYTIIIVGIVPAIIECIITFDDRITNPISLIGIFVTAVSFMLGIFIGFFGYSRYEPLLGVFKGEIVFSNDAITVEGNTFLIEDVQTIFISNFDYKGRIEINPRDRLNFNGKMSQGINNSVSLRLNSGDIITCNFQQEGQFNMENIRHQLIHYNKLGKLDMVNLNEILDIYNFSTA